MKTNIDNNFYPKGLRGLISPVYIIRRKIYTAIKDFAPKITGHVLDFGCGSKPYESLFTSCTTYVGVDVQVSGHNHVNSKIDHYYDGKTLPFNDNSFDAVFSSEVFEHIFNLDEILIELARVTKKGGQLLITTPFAWPEHEAPYDSARYTTFGLFYLLEKAGFQVVESKKTSSYWETIFQLIQIKCHWNTSQTNLLVKALVKICCIIPLNLVSRLILNNDNSKSVYYLNQIIFAIKK